MKFSYGFSLIEIVIVLAIITIILTIAIPNYQHYMIKAERLSAETALIKLATAFEQYYTSNNTYKNISLDELKIKSPDHYLLKIISSTDSDFIIAAEPQSQHDLECGTLMIYSNGKKEATGSLHTEQCWA